MEVPHQCCSSFALTEDVDACVDETNIEPLDFESFESEKMLPRDQACRASKIGSRLLRLTSHVQRLPTKRTLHHHHRTKQVHGTTTAPTPAQESPTDPRTNGTSPTGRSYNKKELDLLAQLQVNSPASRALLSYFSRNRETSNCCKGSLFFLPVAHQLINSQSPPWDLPTLHKPDVRAGVIAP